MSNVQGRPDTGAETADLAARGITPKPPLTAPVHCPPWCNGKHAPQLEQTEETAFEDAAVWHDSDRLVIVDGILGMYGNTAEVYLRIYESVDGYELLGQPILLDAPAEGSMSVEQAKALIAGLQRAVELVEASAVNA